MLDQITLASGPGPSASPTTFKAGPLTVFVGPNNSGKSTALREIDHCLRRAGQGRVVGAVSLRTFESGDDLRELFARTARDKRPDGLLFCNPVSSKAEGGAHLVPHAEFDEAVRRPEVLATLVARWATVWLNGGNRLQLAEPAGGGDLAGHPTNHWMALLFNDAAREALRAAVHDSIGLHLVLDPTSMTRIVPRLAKEPPPANCELSLDAPARAYFCSAQPLSEFSDGVRAYVGILATLLSSTYRLVLLDEPEAFLHPPLVRKLGAYLGRHAREYDANVVVATHSSDFVMGCVESGAPLQVVRLTRTGGVSTARMLSAARLTELMRDPLLRSTNTLAAMFYDGVVVTEADADRAFYGEINHRLQAESPPSGAAGTLFLNAQNKQTIPRIVQPLRELGIPVAAIVDIDVLKNGGAEWTALVRAAGVPDALQLGQTRAHLKVRFEGGGVDMKRDGGINALVAADDQEAARELFQQLARFGVFVVPGGELESWLKHLGVTGKGPPWLIRIFEAMGSEPDAAGYVKPSDGDVWDFTRSVAAWIRNPQRLGIRP